MIEIALSIAGGIWVGLLWAALGRVGRYVNERLLLSWVDRLTTGTLTFSATVFGAYQIILIIRELLPN